MPSYYFPDDPQVTPYDQNSQLILEIAKRQREQRQQAQQKKQSGLMSLGNTAGQVGGQYLGKQAASSLMGDTAASTAASGGTELGANSGLMALGETPTSTAAIAPESGLATAGTYVLPALAAIGSGLAIRDLVKNKRTDRTGYAEGMLTMGIEPGLAMVGINNFRKDDKYKTEGKRIQTLIDSGVNVPESERHALDIKHGRSDKELIELSGDPNFKVAKSAKDLEGKYITWAAAFPEKFGSDWYKKPFEERARIAQAALDQNAVKYHHGTVDVDWEKVKL